MNQNLTTVINGLTVKLGDIVQIANSFFIVTIHEGMQEEKTFLSFAKIKVTENLSFEHFIMNDNMSYMTSKAEVFDEKVKILGNILEDNHILYELKFDYDLSNYAGLDDDFIISIDKVFKKGMFSNIAHDVVNNFIVKYEGIVSKI